MGRMTSPGMPLRADSAAAARAVTSMLTAKARRVTRALARSAPDSSPGSDADQAVTVLYARHYHALTQLAALLVSDAEVAEEIVQDAFVAMHGAWRQLRGFDKAVPYLRQAVVRRSRRICAARPSQRRYQPAAPATGQQALSDRPPPGLAAALRALPPRQREALVLRLYADLPDTQIATAMGIRTRRVSSHVARGISSLQGALEHG